MSYRIIQWSSGNVGKHAIATIAGRKGMELVALYVYSDEKSGNDAGSIAGIDSLGVMATNDRDSLLTCEADCVIHTPLPSLVYGETPDEDLDTICSLLASGKNVITTVGYMYPKVHGSALQDRIEKACQHGGSSFHSTGVNPGWMGDMLPLVMSGLCQRLDQIYVQEITNFEFYPSPSVIFDMMGFGCSPEDFDNHAGRYTNWLNGLFRESIQMVADGLELELDSISVHSEFAVSTRAMKIAAGDVASGTVAGQRWEWAGVVNGEKRIVHETVWRLHEGIGDQWPRGRHSVKIEGSPNMFLDFGDRWNDEGLLSTAVQAVDAIPFVCEAEPGSRTLLELPMITARGGVRG
ncbi:MAG: dihydrodipicolinate reductase, partial [Halieaceae bacterium]|nr:dihydrodipicolinate reductase [Halieaceae bacterium]